MALESNNIGKLCSDPKFISMMYNIVKYGIESVDLPSNTTTVIGGSAFMLYAYAINELNEDNMYRSLRENNVPLTKDIDITVWYDNIIYDFDETNQRVEVFLRELFKNEQVIQLLQTRITRHFGEINTCRAYVLPARSYRNMTTMINIHFVINDEDFKVVDIVIKKPIYSQQLLNESQRLKIKVSENVTYTNKDNTMLLRVNKTDVVRVPTPSRFIDQQGLVFDNFSHRSPEERMKYIYRINYLLKYARPYEEKPHAKGGRTKKNKRSKRSKTRRSIR
jgi:hypothetical protein